MVAHCLYRTMSVGAVLARLVQFLLGWCTSCSVGVTSYSVGALETSAPPESAPPKVHPLRLLLDIPAYC